MGVQFLLDFCGMLVSYMPLARVATLLVPPLVGKLSDSSRAQRDRWREESRACKKRLLICWAIGVARTRRERKFIALERGYSNLRRSVHC